MLVDLHRQFDTLEIGTENFQRKVIDALAGNSELLAELKVTFTKYAAAKKELEAIKAATGECRQGSRLQ
jgi:DNA repair protein RecN (Recombination protein N)